MSRIPFLMRRGNRWYYNRAYPLDVQTVLGKAPFRLALRTESLSEAQRARPEAERRYYAEVDAARQRLASQSGSAAITRSIAEALAVQWFLEKLSDDEEWLTLPSTPELLDKRLPVILPLGVFAVASGGQDNRRYKADWRVSDIAAKLGVYLRSD